MTTQPQRAAFTNWRQEPHHALIYEDPSVAVYIGAVRPNSACEYHSHYHFAFIYCLLSADHVHNGTVHAPHYYECDATWSQVSIKKGSCLPITHQDPDTPFVHKVVTEHDPVAFICIENSQRAYATSGASRVGQVTCEATQGVETHSLPNCPAVSPAIGISLQPGASTRLGLKTTSTDKPLSRVIVGIQGDFGQTEIEQLGQGVVIQQRQVCHALGWKVDLTIMRWTDVDDSLTFTSTIRNNGSQSWSGIVVDIW